jgi:hypothetical protein
MHISRIGLFISAGILVAVATGFLPGGLPFATAQGTAELVRDFLTSSQGAIVKLVVEGKDPTGNDKHAEGSGFFIYSGPGISFLLTAQHVVGSSETEQAKNPDWFVDNGKVVRTIQISSLDEHGNLQSHGQEVFVVPTALPGIDIALLSFLQGGYPTLRLADRLVDKLGPHDVMLLGYQAGRSSITVPIPIGIGQLQTPTTYVTSVPSHRGESGGPWIDIRSGRVFAVARMVNTAPTTPSNESTPVTLIKPSLSAYFQTAGITLDQDVPHTFALLGSRAQATISILGDTGQLSKVEKKFGELGELVTLNGQGSESSQCDSGSGRTVSRASASAQVSVFNVNGLRFEYSASSQGGHYRTAAACFGGLPIGLTGHDTSAQAQVDINGSLQFQIDRSAISVDWNGMPQTGAGFRLTNKEGKLFAAQQIQNAGHTTIEIASPGWYQLDTNIFTLLKSRGSCCGESANVNATITLLPASQSVGQQQ